MKQALTFFFVFLFLFTQAQIIEFNDANLKAKLLESSPNKPIAFNANGNRMRVDTNFDGEIQVEEAEQVFKLFVQNSDISDATGIEFFTSLRKLNMSVNNLTQIDLSNNLDLIEVDINRNELTLVNLLENENLEILYLYENNLINVNVSNNVNLTQLNLNDNNLTQIDLSNNTSLEEVNLNQNEINEIDLTNNQSLISLGLSGNNLTEVDLTNNQNLIFLGLNGNDLAEIDISNNLSLNELELGDNNISSIDVSNHIDLEILVIINNNLTEIDVSNNTNLTGLYLSGNNFSSVDVLNNENLRVLYLSENDFSEIDLSNNPELIFLYLNDNNFSEIDLSNNLNLQSLYFNDNNLSQIDLSNNINLQTLFLNGNELNEIEIADNVNLRNLGVSNNNLSDIDVSNNINLTRLELINNDLTTIDVTECTLLETLYFANENLTSLFLKNGNNENFVLNNFNSFGDLESYGDNLSFICVDDNLDVINFLKDIISGRDIAISSYCSFNPGGEYFTIEGTTKFDINDDGVCDVDDVDVPYLNFDISNQESYGTIYSGQSGNYYIPVSEGTHTISPTFQNDNFTVDPNSFTVNFPNSSNTYIQDICIFPNSQFSDLEVFIVPLNAARPGFDTKYKIIYKNKGTQILSGSLLFKFDEDVMTLNESLPMVSNASYEQLSWEYNDLYPFEQREIFLTFNLNTPTDEENPLNEGDELHLGAFIYPDENDQTPRDNIFTMKQIVFNSYDPNDKTCLEGDSVSPDLVGEYVHYLIRFENTGSANAVNIVVKDIINTNMFDISTLVPLDGSHSFETRVKNGNEVEFIFENIQLPFDDENNDGYINFKIKTLENLEVGDVFENNAEIYFDFNYPIITNTASTLIENLSIEETSSANIQVDIYPNPMIDVLNIFADSMLKSVQLFSAEGNLVSQTTFVGYKKDAVINVSVLPKGVYFIRGETINGVFQRKVIK